VDGQRASVRARWAIGRPTLHDGPVRLRPVRVTPCCCLFLTGVVVTAGVTALMVIGMIGAFMFILIQLVLLVDFAHAWNERWLSNYEESQSRVWFTGIMQLRVDFCVFHLLLINKIVGIMIRALDLFKRSWCPTVAY